MSPENIMDVSESNFEYDVIAFSANTLVVVDFWAEWCQPCKALEPILLNITVEGQSIFRLARLDVDKNPNIAIRYSVRSLPTVIAFREGHAVAELVGLQPEARVREFIEKLSPPSPFGLALEKTASYLDDHRWVDAEKEYRSLLEQHADLPEALLGLVISLLGQGKAGEARTLIRTFPSSREYSRAQLMLPLAEAFIAHENNSLPVENDIDTAFGNCIRLARRGNLLAALDGLLDILRQDKKYRSGRAHQVILGLLELLGPNHPDTRSYRSELASALY
ncbi:MAG TPA: tetratricopeptide repeat protein [Longilinea sp.]|nr:tetratricopeptide repeat protein [Longilinea sp.]